jgi:MoaA/NifB/PqqE/SkfB family radical SAM enzyme
MNCRLADGVRWRHEPFGSVAYVPSRDSFFALDRSHTSSLIDLLAGTNNKDESTDRYLRRLSAAGIIKGTPGQPSDAGATNGLIGHFQSVPVSSRPLLVNCFATAHCPLSCSYCYADDLMMPYREDSEDQLPDRVVSMAESLDALVAVVTGGEPLARPQQAVELLRKLATTKAVVLDTSGVGDIYSILSALKETHAHLRVSLDSPSAVVNNRQRPIRRQYQGDGNSSWKQAIAAITCAANETIPVSVQTVVTEANSDINELARLRDLLIALGVRKWNIHVVVTAGKAGRHPSMTRVARPSQQFLAELADFAADSARRYSVLDLRVTDNNAAPNSVLLIDIRGDLRTETLNGGGKLLLASHENDREELMLTVSQKVNLRSHYSRYLNCDLRANSSGM